VSSVKGAIQLALGQFVLAGPFYEAVYDQRTGFVKAIDPDLARKVKPATLEVNDVESSFVTDSRFGRDLRSRRDTWTFEVIATFAKEVDLSFFEAKACNEPIKLAQHNAIAQLRNARYSHPTRSGNGGGTEVIFTFDTKVGH